MKARVKATGEIVEVIPYSGFDDYDYYEPEEKMPWLKEELVFDVTDKVLLDELDEVYWEKLKHQYAGMAMQGILSNEAFISTSPVEIKDELAAICEELAQALVEKAKEERK